MTQPTDRPGLDQLTSDGLDQLYDELDALKSIAHGYCGHCGRGDCSPTTDQWYEQRQRADQAEATLGAVRAELDRLAALPTIAYDDGRADTFPVGARWTIRIIRENALGEPQKLPSSEPPVHIGNRVNAEDCPGCSGTNPPYPFICPGQPGEPGGPYPDDQHGQTPA